MPTFREPAVDHLRDQINVRSRAQVGAQGLPVRVVRSVGVILFLIKLILFARKIRLPLVGVEPERVQKQVGQCHEGECVLVGGGPGKDQPLRVNAGNLRLARERSEERRVGKECRL